MHPTGNNCHVMGSPKVCTEVMYVCVVTMKSADGVVTKGK
jgi:hypothetical protein